MDGLPVPWITLVRSDGPHWRRFDPLRVLECQTAWKSQGCRLPLDHRAWVVLNDESDVISDAALRRPCLTATLRWCAALAGAGDVEVLEVATEQILADREPLPQRWLDYGDTIRTWDRPQRVELRPP
jgi:hypothetical protein